MALILAWVFGACAESPTGTTLAAAIVYGELRTVAGAPGSQASVVVALWDQQSAFDPQFPRDSTVSDPSGHYRLIIGMPRADLLRFCVRVTATATDNQGYGQAFLQLKDLRFEPLDSVRIDVRL